MIMFSLFLKLVLASLLAAHYGASAALWDPCSPEGATAAPKPGRSRLWPGGIIPYKMNKYLPDGVRMAVLQQIKHWEFSTCIRFIPHTIQNSGFVFFILGERSCAFFGKTDNKKHVVSLSPSVLTNATELNMIFTKMLGISDTTKSTEGKRVLSSGISVGLGGFLSQKSVTSDNNYLCRQETCGYTRMIKNDNRKPLIITSPGYPNSYEANMECVWSIYNTGEKPLSVSFIEINVETYKTGCTGFDYVEVVEVNATGVPSRGEHYCKTFPNVIIIVTSGSKLNIRFHSDISINFKGFKARIIQQKEPHCALNNGGCTHICAPSGTTRMCQCNAGYELLDDGVSCGDIDECKTNNAGCAQVCVNTEGSYHCKCHLGYSRNPDNTTCERCHETYKNEPYVIIHSPSFPGVYSPFHNCVWKITTYKPQFYQINIMPFNLNYSPDCEMDYLKISDHAGNLALPNNGRFCGFHSSITIVSRTSSLTIHFRSRARGGTGFYLIYSQLKEEKNSYVKIDGKQI